MRNPHDIIIKPIITEESMDDMAYRKYAFKVDKRANKSEIKKAIEVLYNVKVDRVNTFNFKGKKKSRSTKAGFITGKTPAIKKAIVTLATGETIDFFSNI